MIFYSGLQFSALSLHANFSQNPVFFTLHLQLLKSPRLIEQDRKSLYK